MRIGREKRRLCSILAAFGDGEGEWVGGGGGGGGSEWRRRERRKELVWKETSSSDRGRETD